MSYRSAPLTRAISSTVSSDRPTQQPVTSAPVTPVPCLASASPPSPPRKPRRLLGLREVMHLTSIARASIYRLLKKSRETGVQLFPPPRQIGIGRIGWMEHEIEEWIINRPIAGLEEVLAEPDDKDGNS